MTKIITLTGEKNTKKTSLALKLGKNSEVEYVRPYSTKKDVDAIYVTRDAMLKRIEDDKPLMLQYINGEVYAFFKHQFKADYCVVIVDDFALVELASNWKGEMYKIKVIRDGSEPSKRVGSYLYDHEFDTVFDYDKDDYNILEAMIE